MQSFNKVIIAGNLVNDPELRYLPGGSVHVSVSVALNSVRGKGDQKKEHVDYIEVAMYGTLAENVAKYRKKGDPVLIEGKLAQQRWEDKATGQKRSKVGVVAWLCVVVRVPEQGAEAGPGVQPGQCGRSAGAGGRCVPRRRARG